MKTCNCSKDLWGQFTKGALLTSAKASDWAVARVIWAMLCILFCVVAGKFVMATALPREPSSFCVPLHWGADLAQWEGGGRAGLRLERQQHQHGCQKRAIFCKTPSIERCSSHHTTSSHYMFLYRFRDVFLAFWHINEFNGLSKNKKCRAVPGSMHWLLIGFWNGLDESFTVISIKCIYKLD